MMSDKIILMGFMGCGKSYMGNRLAKELHVSFNDLDVEIEKKSGKTITQIFADHGESYFRQIERETLEELLRTDCAIIALGGGTPCQEGAIQLIKQHGKLIFIHVDPHILHARLSADDQRPILHGLSDAQRLQKIKKLSSERQCYYDQHDVQVSTYEELVKWVHHHVQF